MIDCNSIVESVIFSAKLGIAVSVMNLIGSGLLIYGALKLRQGNRLLRETSELLRSQGLGKGISG